MSVRTCEICRFYSPASAQIGECRFNPPQGLPVNIQAGQLMSFWPPVQPQHWCGKWGQGSLITMPRADSLRGQVPEGKQ